MTDDKAIEELRAAARAMIEQQKEALRLAERFHLAMLGASTDGPARTLRVWLDPELLKHMAMTCELATAVSETLQAVHMGAFHAAKSNDAVLTTTANIRKGVDDATAYVTEQRQRGGT